MNKILCTPCYNNSSSKYNNNYNNNFNNNNYNSNFNNNSAC